MVMTLAGVSYDVQVKLSQPTPSKAMTGIIHRTMQLTQMELVRNLKINSPVDEGKLQGSWSPIFTNELLRKSVRSSAKYTTWVNEGTGIYGPKGRIIKPKVGRLLGPFKYKGRMIAVPWIRGQKGKHFVEKSITQTKRRTDEFVIRATMEQGGSN